MPPRTALEALTLRPLELLRSPWPWRSLAYLASGGLMGAVIIAAVLVMLAVGTMLAVVVVGLAGYVGCLLSGMVVARVERWRIRLVDQDELPDAHAPSPRAGVRAWLSLRLREEATWRELFYAALTAVLLSWLDLVVIGVVLYTLAVSVGAPLTIRDEDLSSTLPGTFAGLLLGPVLAYPLIAWAGARAAMARAMLAPRDDSRLIEVTASRARLVDGFEVERRRIERDLHDGAQQRLVALSMQLGLARLEVPPEAPGAAPLAAAHDLARQALTDLRELIRGVHPKILTDRGLAAAVGEIASVAPLPVDLDLRLPGRLPPAVEMTAYFVIAEALTNVAKHAGAGRASVTAFLRGRHLILEIGDDGSGGADPSKGSGLIGLADRVAVLDGAVTLASPAGGPTLLRVDIPVPDLPDLPPPGHGRPGTASGTAATSAASGTAAASGTVGTSAASGTVGISVTPGTTGTSVTTGTTGTFVTPGAFGERPAPVASGSDVATGGLPPGRR